MMRVLTGVGRAMRQILTTFIVGIGVVLVLFGRIIRLLPSSQGNPDLSKWSEWPRPCRNQWFDW